MIEDEYLPFEDESLKFDRPLSLRRKKEGMSLAADHRERILDIARSIAQRIALDNPYRLCTADAVQRELIARGIKPKQFGNAAGSLFKNGKWEFVEWKKSRRVSNHARLIGIWRLKPQGEWPPEKKN
jgi:hypothetical protein